jgi:D-methionine transport system substrate-binding protein
MKQILVLKGGNIMKKFLTVVTTVLAIGALTACSSGAEDKSASTDETTKAADTTQTADAAKTTDATKEGTSTEKTKIVVGASITPHAEILAAAKDILAEKGYELEVVEYSDYVQPNLALDSGDLDANYFQHQPYLDQFNEENKTDIVSAGSIHYEPYGIYPGKTKSLDSLADKAKVAVPNDASNEARALLLLEAQGLIKLKEGVGLNATKTDIAENPKNLEIVEIEAAQLARSLPDVDIAVINGNYAIEAGLNVAKDALATEDKDSEAAKTYANIIAVKAGKEQDPAIKALVEALQSDTVKKFIEEKYQGSVVPVF